MFSNKYGVGEFGSHYVQLLGFPTHLTQGELHPVHNPLIGKVDSGHASSFTHDESNKNLCEMHDVH